MNQAAGLHGVYVHIPFCAKRCDYCAFATFTDRHHLQGEYVQALRKHIRSLVAEGMPAATSVFVGGGTPTMLPAEQLLSVLAEIPLASRAEVTVECNPDDITLEMMQQYLRGGVNRVSVGVQSTVDRLSTRAGQAQVRAVSPADSGKKSSATTAPERSTRRPPATVPAPAAPPATPGPITGTNTACTGNQTYTKLCYQKWDKILCQ